MYLARKCYLGTLFFTSPNGDGAAILRGHPSHAKLSPPAGQRKHLHFSVILRPWVMVRPRESNPRPPSLQSNALPTELILPRLERITKKMLWEYFIVVFSGASKQRILVVVSLKYWRRCRKTVIPYEANKLNFVQHVAETNVPQTCAASIEKV